LIDYALTNPYRALINSSEAASYLDSYNKSCLPALNTCSKVSSNLDCYKAENVCQDEISLILLDADFDPYDLRSKSQDPYPPETYFTYLQSQEIRNAIGARVQYQECADAPRKKFTKTGDGMHAPYFSRQ
jgi:hypothetical protein